MTDLAEVLVKLRTDDRQLKQDVESAVRDAGRGPAPRTAGDTAGRSFSSAMGGRINRSIRDEGLKMAQLWALNGNVSGREMTRRFVGALDPLHRALDRLGRRTVRPKVELGGFALTETRIAAINRGLDHLDGRTVDVHVRVRQSMIGRAAGMLGAGIGSFKGGGGGLLGGLAGGLGGAGGAITPALSNPYAAAGAAAAALALLPAAAAAASGGMVAAFGAGFATIAAIGASKSVLVQKSWHSFTAAAGRDLVGISKPFITVINSVIGTARRALPKIMGTLGGVFRTISGPVQSFASTLIRAFTSPTVLSTMRTLGSAFGSLLTSLRPEIPGIIDSIASGIRGIAQAIHDHPQMFTALFTGLGHAVGMTLAFIGALARGFHTVGDGALTMARVSIEAFKLFADSAMSSIGTIVHGAAAALGWLPGIGPKVRAAARSFDGFRAGVDRSLNGAIATIDAWQASWDRAAKNTNNAGKLIAGAFRQQRAAALLARSSIGSLTAAIVHNGAKSSEAKSARQELIADLEAAGVKSKTARADVSRYSNAVAKNGKDSDSARAARKRLLADLLGASGNAAKGKRDLALLTGAIRANGRDSDAARSARKKLISDLTSTGMSSRTARQLVNLLSGAIRNIPGKHHTAVTFGLTLPPGVHATASFQAKRTKYGAQGMLVTGGTPGRDSVPAMLMPGEVVVPTHMVKSGAVDHLRGKIPGFANGGLVGSSIPVVTTRSQVTSAVQAVYQAGLDAVVAAGNKAMQKYMSTLSAGSFGGPIGGGSYGVGQWSGLVLRVLGMLGQSASWLSTVLRRMNQESGGNPRAINLWDSNARAGTPSIGLMQVIGPTFAAYAGPFRGLGIYNPLANTYAGLNYALHRYGSLGALNQPGGYTNGGTITENMAAVGLSTGRRYVMHAGEEIQSRHTAEAQARKLDQILKELRTHPGRIAAGVAKGVKYPAAVAGLNARLGAR